MAVGKTSGRLSLKELFVQARGLSGDAREDFLDFHCGDDNGRRARLEAMLEARTKTVNVQLDAIADALAPRGGVPTTDGSEEAPKVSGYKIGSKLGEGGMGIVYVAEQLVPVHRRVALKVSNQGWTHGKFSLNTSLTVGVHTLTFTAIDNEGASSSDSVIVTVVANQVPSANAGVDQSASDNDGSGAQSVTLNGIGADSDGTIASFQHPERRNPPRRALWLTQESHSFHRHRESLRVSLLQIELKGVDADGRWHSTNWRPAEDKRATAHLQCDVISWLHQPSDCLKTCRHPVGKRRMCCTFKNSASSASSRFVGWLLPSNTGEQALLNPYEYTALDAAVRTRCLSIVTGLKFLLLKRNAYRAQQPSASFRESGEKVETRGHTA